MSIYRYINKLDFYIMLPTIFALFFSVFVSIIIAIVSIFDSKNYPNNSFIFKIIFINIRIYDKKVSIFSDN